MAYRMPSVPLIPGPRSFASRVFEMNSLLRLLESHEEGFAHVEAFGIVARGAAASPTSMILSETIE